MRASWAIIAFASAYLAAAAVPMETLWFAPGEPIFKDTVVGGDPELVFSRDIRRDAMIRYSVIIRNAEDKEVVCEWNGGPFKYLEQSGPLIGKTLGWWAPGDNRCAHLPVGTYYGQVEWTAVRPLGDLLPGFLKSPLGWLLPPKSVTREIMVFNILPVLEAP